MDVQLRHLGLYTNRIDEMAEFYGDLFGMARSDEGHLSLPGNPKIVFLSAHPQEHHELALIDGGDDLRGPVQQISFEASSPDDLREVATKLEARQRTAFPVNHCVSWSLYTPDPDGNLVEIYVKTPWYVPQPIVDPLDLSLDDQSLAEHTFSTYRNRDGFCTREQWMATFQTTLDNRVR